MQNIQQESNIGNANIYIEGASNALDQETHQHIESMKSGQNNILVVVRARPLFEKEAKVSPFETIKVLENKMIVLLDPLNEDQNEQKDILRKNRNKETQFAFDYAFDKNTDQREVYRKSCQFLIDGVLEGFNATVFAYGATGAGKTYTMVGLQDKPGLMFLITNNLFQKIEDDRFNQYLVKVSYLEIYNENIKDLLTVDDKNLDLREDPLRGICIAGITEIVASNTQEIMAMMKIGNRNRTMEATAANDVSSRSHAILQVVIEHKKKNQGIDESLNIAKLSMVDLAGSERGAHCNNKGMRLIEGAKINQSLLVLGNCIQALSEQNQSKQQQKQKSKDFISYRGSKLTRLLKDSLGGNCRTVMIANVSPCESSFEDTYNTLNFANRTKNIKTQVKRNVLNVANHISQYSSIIQGLKQENDELKKALVQINDKQIISPKDKHMEDQVEYMAKIVKGHFQTEIHKKEEIFGKEIEIENLNFEIYKQLTEGLQKPDFNSKVELAGQKQQLMQLNEQKSILNMALNQIIKQRGELQTKINDLSFNEKAVTYLNNLFQYKLLSSENADFMHHEQQFEQNSKHKQYHIKFLSEQLMKKDLIIESQRQLMQKNNLSNSKYNSYKNVLIDFDQINEHAMKYFPQIELPSFMNKKPSLNKVKKVGSLKKINQVQQYEPNEDSKELNKNYHNNLYKNANKIQKFHSIEDIPIALTGKQKNQNQNQINNMDINTYKPNNNAYVKKQSNSLMAQKSKNLSNNLKYQIQQPVNHSLISLKEQNLIQPLAMGQQYIKANISPMQNPNMNAQTQNPNQIKKKNKVGYAISQKLANDLQAKSIQQSQAADNIRKNQNILMKDKNNRYNQIKNNLININRSSSVNTSQIQEEDNKVGQLQQKTDVLSVEMVNRKMRNIKNSVAHLRGANSNDNKNAKNASPKYFKNVALRNLNQSPFVQVNENNINK